MTSGIPILRRSTGKTLYTYPGPSLIEADLADLFLVGADFGAAELCGVRCDRALLAGATFLDARLNEATFLDADLDGADLNSADCDSANFTGASLVGATCSDTQFTGANLTGANLRNANLTGANLTGANLAGANLAGADLNGINLVRATLGDLRLLDGGLRSDGYRFLYTDFLGEGPRIHAGCHTFTPHEARTRWCTTRGGTPLGAETDVLLDYLLAQAHTRWGHIPPQHATSPQKEN